MSESIYQKRHREKHGERIRARRRAAYAANRERILAVEKARRALDPAHQKEIYDRARRKARGANPPTRSRPEFCEMRGCVPGPKGLVEDHCHKTGAFRGWLCTRCNIGIGNLGDDLQGVQAAVRYLEKQ